MASLNLPPIQELFEIINKEVRVTNKTGKDDNKLALTKEEEKLIKIFRTIDFGEVRVVINDGKPTRLEEIKKSIKL